MLRRFGLAWVSPFPLRVPQYPRAIMAIRQGIKALGKHPQIGRPAEEMPPEFREWVIEFRHGAYVALYHYNGKQVVILAVRHGHEAGY